MFDESPQKEEKIKSNGKFRSKRAMIISQVTGSIPGVNQFLVEQ